MDTRTPAQKRHDERRDAYERQRRAILDANPCANMPPWEEMHVRPPDKPPTAGVAPLKIVPHPEVT